jgi:hypothetical protein
MTTHDEELRMLVEDLIRVSHQQSREMEKLVEHIGRSIGRLPELGALSILGSELSSLHLRARKLVNSSRSAD